MKTLYTYTLSLILALCALPLHADKRTDYLSTISIENREVVKKNRSVELSMQMDFSQMKMRTQHTLALTPVLISKDSTQEITFPPVVIDGRTRNKVYLRAQRLESVELPPYHNDNAQVIIRRKNGTDQQYTYTATVPYHRWMLDGRVEMREEVHGCTNCQKGTSTQPLAAPVLPKFIPTWKLDTIAPEPEPIKVRAETRTARLQFRQDSYKIDPKYKGNQAELDTVYNSIDLVQKNTDVTITGIYITGYASPEGSVPHNIKLSENRARALTNWIRRTNDLPQSLMHVDWKGEDWEGFREALAQFPGLLKRDEVYRVIDECNDDRDKCEKLLVDMQPSTIYERLLAEVYPILRRNEYRVEYNVRNFNLEEARKMLVERPDLLSLVEMYKVAGSYEKDSPEYNRAMETAAKYYPQEPATLNDRALAAIEKGDYNTAVAILENGEPTATNPKLLNTLGVAYAGAGAYDKAKATLEKAKALGLPIAGDNLTQVNGVVDQL